MRLFSALAISWLVLGAGAPANAQPTAESAEIASAPGSGEPDAEPRGVGASKQRRKSNASSGGDAPAQPSDGGSTSAVPKKKPPSTSADVVPPPPPAPPLPPVGGSAPPVAPGRKKWTVEGVVEKPYLKDRSEAFAKRLNKSRPQPDEDPADFADAFKDRARLRRNIVVDGNDTQGLLENFDFILNEPVHPAALQRARKVSAQARDATVDDAALARLARARMAGSVTMVDPNVNAEVARQNWAKADGLVRRRARMRNQDVTADEILDLADKVNDTLLEGVAARRGRRLNEDVWSGDLDTTADDANATLMYLPGSEVQRRMRGLAEKIAKGLKDPSQDPIELAARSYQEMVSIHPYHDGNGRTARFLMDFVLQRQGLPPAALDGNVNLAAFPRLAADIQPSPTTAVNVVREGVERSYRLSAAGGAAPGTSADARP